MLKDYVVTIVMSDGSQGKHCGAYASGCDAILAALEVFPDARRVSAMHVEAS